MTLEVLKALAVIGQFLQESWFMQNSRMAQFC